MNTGRTTLLVGALVIVGIVWLPPLAEGRRTWRWKVTESNQQLEKEVCRSCATHWEWTTRRAKWTLDEELSEARPDLTKVGHERLLKSVYLEAMDAVLAEEWEWEGRGIADLMKIGPAQVSKGEAILLTKRSYRSR